MIKILVTGAAGFIGHHLVKQLLELGNYDIWGLDNINDYYDTSLKWARLADSGIVQSGTQYGQPSPSSTHPNYTFIQLDLADRSGMETLFDQQPFQVVVNLAAQAGIRYSLENPHSYADSNLVGFLNILEGCRKLAVDHLVYASSSSVYGLNSKMPLDTHDHTEHPISLYAATKKANEMMAHSYSHLYKIPTTGLRFFTVYGPWGRPDMAPMLFASAIHQGRPIKVFNNGEMYRDFTYIDDIVQGIIQTIGKPAQPSTQFDPAQPDPAISSAPYKVINIGNADPVKLGDFIAEIESAMGKEAVKEMYPLQPGDVLVTNADVRDLVEEYGYRPKVKLKEGVRSFIDWFKSYYA
jgi:UDP-glucuronate 4-epimerase